LEQLKITLKPETVLDGILVSYDAPYAEWFI